MTTLSTKDKTYENLLRRAALRQGYLLIKCRRRDPQAIGYGLYLLIADKAGNRTSRYGGQAAVSAFARGEGLSLSEVEHELGPLNETRSGTRAPRTEMKEGNRYGHWTLMSTVTERSDNYSTMLCRCDCGTERRVKTQNLRRGTTTSCGECEYARPPVVEPVVGDVFEWWKVIDAPHANGTTLCQCRCGRQRRVNTRRLRLGETKSCGCAAKWRTGTFAPTQFEGARP